MNSVLNQKEILTNINSKIEVIVLDNTVSTNLFAKEITSKYDHDVVIVANKQTSGRGRLGRTFVSNESSGIYMSYLIKPDILLEDCKLITPLVCVATCKAIEKCLLEENYKLDTKIKWVNDIYIKQKKVCGILVEAITYNNKPSSLIIGIGINCYKQQFPSELENIVTTIEDETNIKLSRNKLIGYIVNNIDNYLNDFSNKIYMKEYVDRSFIIGKVVEFKLFNETFLAKVLNILEDGSIQVEKDNKEVINIFSGEITRLVIKHES